MTMDPETKKAPWPEDYIFRKVADCCHGEDPETAIKGARCHASNMGIRMGNTLLAYEVEIVYPPADARLECCTRRHSLGIMAGSCSRLWFTISACLRQW